MDGDLLEDLGEFDVLHRADTSDPAGCPDQAESMDLPSILVSGRDQLWDLFMASLGDRKSCESQGFDCTGIPVLGSVLYHCAFDVLLAFRGAAIDQALSLNAGVVLCPSGSIAKFLSER